jgi:di/tricarboxylate transporter
MIVGILYVIASQKWLLPERKPPLADFGEAREYAIEMLLESTSPMIGKSVEEAGLRQLPGAFLAEIERGATVLPAVAPTEKLQDGDRLLFVGVVDSVGELLRLRGLVPAPEQVFKLSAPRPERRLFEVVVSDTCPVAGRTIRDGRFRTLYNAVVIAVARNGERLRGKIGDIELRAGDTLLLESGPNFLAQQRNSKDFLLVSELQGVTIPRHDKSWIAIGILGLMVVLAATALLSMLEAALLAAGLMLATRCLKGNTARASVDWSVLTVIGASFGVGQALQTSGAAEALAETWLAAAGTNPFLALAAVYVFTNVITEMVTDRRGHGRIARRQPVAVRDHRHDGGLGGFRNAHRLSDEPHGLRSGGVSILGLCPHRPTFESARRRHHRRARAAVLAVLTIVGG